jgi:hypothetical protein
MIFMLEDDLLAALDSGWPSSKTPSGSFILDKRK